MTQIEADISNETQVSTFSDSNSTQTRYKIKNLAHQASTQRNHGTLNQTEQMDRRVLIYRTWFVSFVLLCEKPVLIIYALIAMRRFLTWWQWGFLCKADSRVPFPEILTIQIRGGFWGSVLLTNAYMGPGTHHSCYPLTVPSEPWPTTQGLHTHSLAKLSMTYLILFPLHSVPSSLTTSALTLILKSPFSETIPLNLVVYIYKSF